nr:MAG TPA: hypothetical protein [Siphoviridae sp. ctJsG2]
MSVLNVLNLSSFLVQHVCNHTYNFQSNNRFRLAKSCKIQAANPFIYYLNYTKSQKRLQV